MEAAGVEVLMNECYELVLLIERHRAMSDHLKQHTRSQMSKQLILGDPSKCQGRAVTVELRTEEDGSPPSTQSAAMKIVETVFG